MDELLSIHPDDWAKFQSKDIIPLLGFFQKRVELIKEMCDIESNYDVNKSPINKCSNCSKYRHEHDSDDKCIASTGGEKKKFKRIPKADGGVSYWDEQDRYSKRIGFPYRNIITRKPGKKEFLKDSTRRHHDLNFSAVIDGNEIRDTKFSDLWWPLLTNSDDELVSRLGAVIYRMGRMLDHNKDADGSWRLALPEKLEKYFIKAGPIKIRDKKEKIDIGIIEYLNLIDCLFLDEDLFYFRQTNHWLEIIDDGLIDIPAKYSPFSVDKPYPEFTGRISCSLAFMEMINLRINLLKSTTLDDEASYFLDYSDRMMRENGIVKLVEATGSSKNKIQSKGFMNVFGGKFISGKTLLIDFS